MADDEMDKELGKLLSEAEREEQHRTDTANAVNGMAQDFDALTKILLGSLETVDQMRASAEDMPPNAKGAAVSTACMVLDQALWTAHCQIKDLANRAEERMAQYGG